MTKMCLVVLADAANAYWNGGCLVNNIDVGPGSLLVSQLPAGDATLGFDVGVTRSHIADSFTVLRDGKHVATEPIGATNPERVVLQMVGRELTQYTSQHLQRQLGEELLRVENLS